MTSYRPVRAGGPERGSPVRRLARLGLFALSLSALLFEGCASFGGGRNACETGRCGMGRLGSCNLTHRWFNRRAAVVAPAAEACDGNLGVISSGEPAMVPGPVLSAPPPTTGDADPNLQPLPSGPDTLKAPAGGTGTQGSNSGGAVKSMYQTQNNRSRGEATEARRESGRYRPGGSRLSGPAEAANERDPLADLPNLNVPAESSGASPGDSSPPSPPSAGERPAASQPTAPAETTAGQAPGIHRFKVVEQWLAAGSLPTSAGWEWLVEKGYKTVLDLRQPGEMKAEEIAAINHYGFKLVSIPTSLTAIDPEGLKRFEAEVARNDARPMFVFDADGTRPASLMFLHLVMVGKFERRDAERKVEELGGGETPLFQSALTFLASHPSSRNTDRTSASATPSRDDSPEADSGSTNVAMLPALSAPSPEPREATAGWSPLSLLGAKSSLVELGRTAVSYGGRALASLPAAESAPSAARAESGG